MRSKIVAGLLILGLSAPVLAQHGYHHHHHHGGGGGNWVAPLILGGIIGAAIATPRPQPPVVYGPPPVVYYPPLQTCREVLTIQIDQYGREYRYPQTVCNY